MKSKRGLLRSRSTTIGLVLTVILAPVVGATAGASAVGPARSGAAIPTQQSVQQLNETVNISTAPTINQTGPGRIQIDIGDNRTNMTIALDLSMLLNLPDAGNFGVYTWGHANGQRAVTFLIAIQFQGIGPLGRFFANPFSRFDVTTTMRANLPFPI